MKTKEKTKKHIKFTLKSIVTFFSSGIIILNIIIFYNLYFSGNVVYAEEVIAKEEQNIIISNAEKIDIEYVMQKNIQIGLKEEFVKEEIDLEYMTNYKKNSDLAKGTIQVIQEGRNGKQEITVKKTFENDELVEEQQIANKIIKAAINKIVEIGTGDFINNYKAKVGDLVVVTSDRLSVRVESNEESQKIGTLVNGNELKILEIQGQWYKISNASTTRIC